VNTFPDALKSTPVTAADWSSFIDGVNLILAHYNPRQIFSGTWLAGLAAVLSPISHEINQQKLQETGWSLMGYIAEWNRILFMPKGLRVDFHDEHVSAAQIETSHTAKHMWRQLFRLGTGGQKRWLNVHALVQEETKK